MSTVRSSALWSLLLITVSGCSLVSDFGDFKFKKSDKADGGGLISDAGADAGKGKPDAGKDAGMHGKPDSGVKDASVKDADTEDSGKLPDSGIDSGSSMPGSVCGNGTIEGDEECDDHNGLKGDGCEPNCTITCLKSSECSDSNPCNGVETCNTSSHVCVPAASNASDGTTCKLTSTKNGKCESGQCAPTSCGDGNMDSGEQCDDGNTVNDDGCDNNCTVSACGNGVVAGTEQCDTKGESVACNANCTIAACGDTVLNVTQGEKCDPGAETAACNDDCSLALCGDGKKNVTANEACDDGNKKNNDDCLNSCKIPYCGDGFKYAGDLMLLDEKCDDGNTTDGDGCDNNCTVSACGNSVVAGDETCDDGNAKSGDGCDENCKPTGCGNGFACTNATDCVGPNLEACDDGNSADGDGCDSNCTVTGCGNGIVTTGEACDDGNNVDSDSCTNACKLAGCGDGVKSGTEECDDMNTTNGDGCDNNCTSTKCGNNIKTSGEACDDGNNVDGDGCDTNCKATACGNGITTTGEMCDDGNLTDGDGCDSNCKPTSCGNGIKTGTEACDDGNLTDNDGCDSNCKATACGNGVKAGMEACDDGNLTNNDGCDSNCTVTACGNGIKAGSEACDDGNMVSGDGCDVNCKVSACGNGVKANCSNVAVCGTTVEDCDDGNATNGDGCDSNCTATGCGNGIKTGTEACDDGNVTNGDGCDNNCTTSACGNGIKAGSEQCDDGNATNGDGCDNNCKTTACGNGIKTGTEACDDGNQTNGDGCDNNCTVTACGNGIKTGSEACDDGNAVNGDGCDNNCTATACGNGIKTQGEGCDDGNQVNGDGCDNNCKPSGCGNCVKSGTEACDDCNAVEGDGCDSNCTVSACGNTIKAPNEQCDDGNLTSGDGCDSNCKPTGCGNGVVTAGETCDDGNATNGDGCDNNCKPTGCGNGIKTGAEACDDGNVVSGDGCSASCVVEKCQDGAVNNNSVKVTELDFEWLATACGGQTDQIKFMVNGHTVLNDRDNFTCNCQPGLRLVKVTDPSLLSYVTPGASNTFGVEFGGYFSWALVTVQSTTGSDEVIIYDYMNTGGAHARNDNLCTPGYVSPPFTASVMQTTMAKGEQCDDGNANNGDGCDKNCNFEPCMDADNDSFCENTVLGSTGAGADICGGSDDGDDPDRDGVPTGCDKCIGYDDHQDNNGNKVIDGCDPCYMGSTLTLNEFDRSALVRTGTSNCDKNNSNFDGTHWFRFAGPAGNAIATWPPNANPGASSGNDSRCGTDAAGWLNGTHPLPSDGIQSKQICFGFSTYGSCWQTNQANVLACGNGDYVYQFQAPISCNYRYCGNGVAPPPASNFSSTSIAGPRERYGFAWYLGAASQTCDQVCGALPGGQNLAPEVQTTAPWGWADTNCSSSTTNLADVSVLFYNTGNAGGWSASTSSTAYKTLGYGYPGMTYYGKCAAGTNTNAGTFPGNPNSGTLNRSLVCPCYRAGGLIFAQDFTGGSTASTAIKNEWAWFRTTLARAIADGRTFQRVIIRGTNDPIGHICSGATAQTLAMNLANGTTASSISCGGYSWSTTGGSYYGIGTENSASSCANDPAYAIRPDVGTANWGGIGTTCNGAASQHLELVFDY